MAATPSRIAPRLYRQAADELARLIADGDLRPGTDLTQAGIARRFGISRAPARMALEELAQRQLLVRSASSRYRIAEGHATAASRTPAPADTPLTLHTSWQLLYPVVEMDVVSRSSLASWRVNEAALARHHGVSRTVARDVIGRLHQRGILRKDDSGRWIAPALTSQNMGELYELRWLLEPAAMEKAAPRLPQGLLVAMRDELHVAMTNPAELNSATLDRLEHRLHVELLGHCGNEALMRAISLPQALLVAHHFLYQWTLELFGVEPFLGEHLKIVNRLLANDIVGAKSALTGHLKISRRRAMLRIQAVQDLIQPEALPYMERLP